MNLYDFIGHEDTALPMTWNLSIDFEEFISNKFDLFLNRIDKLDNNSITEKIKSEKKKIHTCCNSIKDTIKSILGGHPYKAYQCFDCAIRTVKSEIHQQMTSLKTKKIGVLYRIRITDTPELCREEIFHIPFELRYRVATQRYSIPGLPCLYLSGSLYTCWEEMGRPPFHKIQVAAFKVKTNCNIEVLNFSNRPLRLLGKLTPSGDLQYNKDEDLIVSHIILWPLMASCSIIVKYPEAPYKPEYIIPQMVLQWVTENKGVDGVCYFSSHVRSISNKIPQQACNFVFPAQEVTATGHCAKLCGFFEITQPCGWQLLRAINNLDDYVTISGGMEWKLRLLGNREDQYAFTDFANIETKLSKLEFDELKNT